MKTKRRNPKKNRRLTLKKSLENQKFNRKLQSLKKARRKFNQLKRNQLMNLQKSLNHKERRSKQWKFNQKSRRKKR